MKTKPNAAQAGAPIPANEKAPSTQTARGPEKFTSKRVDFREVVIQTQGKRSTVAFVADLTLNDAKRLRDVFPNSRARMALSLAEAMGHQYVVAAGHLMRCDADAFVMTLSPDTEADVLRASVLAAHSKMAALSDVTAWSILLGGEMRDVVSQALEAARS
jgi:hypothetical protein